MFQEKCPNANEIILKKYAYYSVSMSLLYTYHCNASELGQNCSNAGKIIQIVAKFSHIYKVNANRFLEHQLDLEETHLCK